MSLEQHSIDQGYKARLADLEVTPPAHAWAAIAAQLPNKKSDEKGAWWFGSGAAFAKTPGEKSKRERVLFWWWTGALLALAAISVLAYYGINSTTAINNPSPTPKPSAASLGSIAAKVNDDFKRSHNYISTEAEEDCPEVTAKSSTAASTTTAVASMTKTPKATTAAKSNDVRLRRTNRGIEANGNVLANSNDNIDSKVAGNKTTSTTTPQFLEGTVLLTDTKTTIPTTSIAPVGLSMATMSLSELPITDLSPFESETTKLPFGPGVGCADFNNSADWSFAVRAFAGPGVLFQTFNSTDQTMAYETLRDSIETRQLSVHGGLRFEAVNDRGLLLRAGADYMMYRTNIVDAGAPRTRTIIDSVFMEDTQTWRVETRNEVFQRQRNVYNRQHAVVLTAGVGFRKTLGNVSPYLMAEAGYELLFKRKGDFVLPDGNFVDLAEDDQGLYINDRPGFQFGGVIGVDFALTDRIEAGISGHYKQLGGLRGSADLLDYKQSTAFGALNLRYTIR